MFAVAGMYGFMQSQDYQGLIGCGVVSLLFSVWGYRCRNDLPPLDRQRYKTLKNTAIQLLETVFILETTRNIYTYKSRYTLLLKIYDDFIRYSIVKTYANEMGQALEHYRLLYYDKPVTDAQIALLMRPDMPALKEFAADNAVRCLADLIEFEGAVIQSLKRQAAKERHRETLLLSALEIDRFLSDNGLSVRAIDEVARLKARCENMDFD